MQHELSIRSEVEDPVFLKPKQLRENMLPTYKKIMQFYLLALNDLKPDNNLEELTVSKICTGIADSLKAASIAFAKYWVFPD